MTVLAKEETERVFIIMMIGKKGKDRELIDIKELIFSFYLWFISEKLN